MRIKLSKLEDKIAVKLEWLTERSRNAQGFINRTLYPMYQQAQIQRWQTEGGSEGAKWKPLNPEYKKRKLKQFAGFPYGGTKMLIATGTLFQSVVGSDPKFHRKVVTNTGLVVSTSVPYAREVHDARPFMTFEEKSQTIQNMRASFLEYLNG